MPDAFRMRYIEAFDTKQLSVSANVTASSRGDNSVSFSTSFMTLRRTSSGLLGVPVVCLIPYSSAVTMSQERSFSNLPYLDR